MPLFMNERIKKLFSDSIVLISFIGIAIIIVVYIIFLLLTFRALPPVVPLFNQVPWGEGRLAPKIQLLIPLGIASAIVIFNTSILLFFSSDTPLVTRLVSLTNFLVILFALLLVIRTVLIVI